MSSDYRMMQHDAAMATHALTGTIEQLQELQRRYPKIVAAEYQDILAAWHALTRVVSAIEIKAA